jgi:hypothetical protein
MRPVTLEKNLTGKAPQGLGERVHLWAHRFAPWEKCLINAAEGRCFF